MSDPITAAEQAAYTAYGTMSGSGEVQRVKDALTAYRTVLAAAGLLRDEAAYTPHAAVLAARFLAAESRFPRYEADGWEMLLTSTVDVEVAYNKARDLSKPDEDGHRRDLAHARRVLLTLSAQGDAQGPTDDTPPTATDPHRTLTVPTEQGGDLG